MSGGLRAVQSAALSCCWCQLSTDCGVMWNQWLLPYPSSVLQKSHHPGAASAAASSTESTGRLKQPLWILCEFLGLGFPLEGNGLVTEPSSSWEEPLCPWLWEGEVWYLHCSQALKASLISSSSSLCASVRSTDTRHCLETQRRRAAALQGVSDFLRHGHPVFTLELQTARSIMHREVIHIMWDLSGHKHLFQDKDGSKKS